MRLSDLLFLFTVSFALPCMGVRCVDSIASTSFLVSAGFGENETPSIPDIADLQTSKPSLNGKVRAAKRFVYKLRQGGKPPSLEDLIRHYLVLFRHGYEEPEWEVWFGFRRFVLFDSKRRHEQMLRDLNDDVIFLARKILELRGNLFREAGAASTKGIVIVASESGQVSALAAKVSREHLGLPLVFWPYFLWKRKAGAVYQGIFIRSNEAHEFLADTAGVSEKDVGLAVPLEADELIYIPGSLIVSEAPGADRDFIHEIEHADEALKRKRGEANPFVGQGEGELPDSYTDSYSRFLTFDELVRGLGDVLHSLKEIKSSIQMGQDIKEQLSTLATKIIIGLSNSMRLGEIIGLLHRSDSEETSKGSEITYVLNEIDKGLDILYKDKERRFVYSLSVASLPSLLSYSTFEEDDLYRFLLGQKNLAAYYHAQFELAGLGLVRLKQSSLDQETKVAVIYALLITLRDRIKDYKGQPAWVVQFEQDSSSLPSLADLIGEYNRALKELMPSLN